MRFRWILCLIFLLFFTQAHAEELTLTAPEALRPGQRSMVTLTVPADGLLTVTVTDARGSQSPLAWEKAVPKGSVTLPFKGLSYGGMPLKRGASILSARLTTASSTLEAQQRIEIYAPLRVLEYALPRSAVVYREPRISWSAECGVSKKCVVRLELFSDAQQTNLIARVRKTVGNAGIFRVPWDGSVKGGTAAAGLYYGRIAAEGQESDAREFTLEIRDGAAPSSTPAVGSMLPVSSSDEDVWAAMMQPLTVLDIPSEEHQKLAEKSNGRGNVGLIHGQTHGVEILSMGSKYTLVRTARQDDGATVEGYVPTSLLKTVVPDPQYGLLLDEGTQTLTVYEQGKRLGQLRVTTGVEEKPGYHYRGTLTGAFLTEDHMPSFESGGYRYEYPIRIDGGNLLHQMGYNEKSGFADEISTLGQKASAGCVRMDYRTDEVYTLNAYWLWTHIRCNTKVLIIDSSTP